VLDAVTYVGHAAIEDAFRKIAGQLPGWDRRKTSREGKWRFVAFSRASGESGDTMLHRWRSAAGLSGRQYDELFIGKRDLLREGLTAEDTVVFLDDFAGTGRQVSEGWRDVMAELLPGKPTTYLVLVAVSEAAKQRISRETPLRVESGVLLKREDDIFSPECPHFSAQERQAVLRYCVTADGRHPRGFGDCGFVIVLAHKTPNNSIPILHVRHSRWEGLFPRH
jgi:hypothetical protein